MTEPAPYRAPAAGAPVASAPPPTSQPWTLRSVFARAWRAYKTQIVALTLASIVEGTAMAAMGFIAARIAERIPAMTTLSFAPWTRTTTSDRARSTSSAWSVVSFDAHRSSSPSSSLPSPR